MVFTLDLELLQLFSYENESHLYECVRSRIDYTYTTETTLVRFFFKYICSCFKNALLPVSNLRTKCSLSVINKTLQAININHLPSKLKEYSTQMFVFVKINNN